MAEEANSGVQDAAAFCGDCGAQSNGASFCQHCGKRLKRPAVSVGTRPVPGAEAVASPQVARGASQNGHPTPAAPVGELPTMPVTTYEAYPTPPGGTRAQPSAANTFGLPGPPELSAPPTVYMAPKNRSNRGWLIAGVVIGVIAIAGAAIAIVLALSKKNAGANVFAAGHPNCATVAGGQPKTGSRSAGADPGLAAQAPHASS